MVFIANPGSEPTRSSAGHHPKNRSGITQGATRIYGCAKLRCPHLWMPKLRYPVHYEPGVFFFFLF